MKKPLQLLILIATIIPYLSFAQCSETPVTRVMIIGDSWAQFLGSDNTINTTFQKWGHSNYKFFTNATLAQNGTQTTDFVDPARLAEIQNQLTLNPDIDLVHLSLGGNDVLGNWNINYTPSQTDSLLDSVYARLVYIIDFIKTAKPGVRILWSGYTYPNFGEIIGELAPFQSTHPFYATWQGMGFPDFTQLNTILNSYSVTMDTLAANDPQVDFVRATGLMQYAYGQNTALSVPPGGTYAPLTAPLPDGFPTYPSPKASMRNYIIFRDCFHLTPEGYSVFLDYHTQKFYHKILMDDQYILSEGGTRDGSVSDAGTVSSQLQLGNSGTEDFATVLSFNTTAMPDTGISKASIFLRRSALSGANPSTGNLQVRIVNGAFSASVDVEASDYTSPGDATDTPCQFGSTADNGHWIRLELPASLLPYITNDTLTQFIISASGATGLVTFTDATDPDFAPVLNLTYGPVSVGLADNAAEDKSVTMYPNPTNGSVMMDTNGQRILEISVYNTTGQLIANPDVYSNSIDLSSFSSGIYMVKITTAENVITKRIVKK